MATKIIANKTKVIDITAKKDDDFLVELDIKDEQDNFISFQRDQYTASSQTLVERNQSLAAEDVMLFVITTEDGNPVLAACSSDLDLAMPDKALDPTGHLLDNGDLANGFYRNPTNQRDFDKLYDRHHIFKIMAIAKILSKASTKNTEEEKTNYRINNFRFTTERIYHSDPVSSAPIIKHPRVTDWLYNIFTNTDVIKNSIVEQKLKGFIFDNNWNGNFEDNRYIFWGKVEGNNSFTISFPHDKFNLPKGNYSYTFKSLSGFTSTASSGAIHVDDSSVNTFTFPIIEPLNDTSMRFSNVTTWIEGKLKIIE